MKMKLLKFILHFVNKQRGKTKIIFISNKFYANKVRRAI